jgi:hypothetical protein
MGARVLAWRPAMAHPLDEKMFWEIWLIEAFRRRLDGWLAKTSRKTSLQPQ